MRSEAVPRCENCGIRLEGGEPGLCKSCAYRRKKQQAKAPGGTPSPPAARAAGPDVAELRERLRKVEEGLRD